MPQPELVIVIGGDEIDSRRIRAAAADWQVEFLQSADARPDLLAKATVLAGRPPAVLAAAPRLRWIHSWSAGVDKDLTQELIDSPIVITSSAGNGAVPLAEHAMMLMLMLNRNVPRWMRAQAEHRWDRFEHGELNGLTCGIIGLGNSGADLALKAKAFHMRVVGVRRNADSPVPGVDRIYPPAGLSQLLSESDFVVVGAPLTPATANMLGASEFRTMKRSAYIVCYSRGGIIDDDALLTALTQGWIAGAGLDAHGTEPLPADSPIWDLDNVIITPHNGAVTEGTRRRAVDIFLINLAHFKAGRTLTNLVDKTAGY